MDGVLSDDSGRGVTFHPDTPDTQFQVAKRQQWLESQGNAGALSRAEQASEGDGTFLSSVFTCANSAIGAGVLAFPYAFAQTGLVLGVVLSLVLATIMLVALHIIIVGTNSSNAASYQALVRHSMGPRAEKVVAVLMVVYLFGAITGYFIVIGDMIPPLFALIPNCPAFLLDKPAELQHSILDRPGRTIVMGVLSTAVCFPLCLLKKISALSYSSGAAIVAIAYMVILVVVKSVTQMVTDADAVAHAANASAAALVARPPTVLVRPSPSIFLAVPLVAFALQAHVQVPNIYASLSTTKRNDLCCRGKVLKQVWVMDWILIASYAICLGFYIPAGIFGYLQFGEGATPADILSKGGYPEGDVTVIIARICVALTAIACVPLNHFPARVAIWGLYRHVRYGLGASNAAEGEAEADGTPKPDLTKIPPMFHIVETTVFFFGALLLAELCTDISTVFDLLGSTIAVLVIFILPAWFFWVYLAGGRGGTLLAKRSNRLGICYRPSCRRCASDASAVRAEDDLAAGLLVDPVNDARAGEEGDVDSAPDTLSVQRCNKALAVALLVIGVLIFCSSTATTIVKMVLTYTPGADVDAISKICLTPLRPCHL